MDAMDAETVQRLEAINTRFYERHADAFDRARQHPWPGWQRVIAGLDTPVRVLDAGCGAGRFRALLEARGIPVARYVGVDRSARLIDRASARCPDAEWENADLFGALDEGPFDLVVAFGVLHHVAGRTRRRDLVRRLADRLDDGGRLALTVWQFAEAPRFARRTVPWAAYNAVSSEPVDERALEDGDRLLRWQNNGVRYCNQASDDEVAAWRVGAGPPLVADHRSDGQGGAMNRYLIFERSRGR